MTVADQAQLALILSIASAVVALGNLGWQLVQYRLSGARLKVSLIPIVVSDTGRVIRGLERGWVRGGPERWVEHWVEVAQIQVVNTGRLPITVSEIGLDLGPARWWRPWSRHTITGFPISIDGCSDTTDHVRLEPGELVRVVVDVWRVTSHRREKPLTVRGSAHPAGRRRQRSPWRHRWSIAPGQEQLIPWELTEDDLLYQAVWRVLAPFHFDEIDDAWIGVLGLLREHRNSDGELGRSVSQCFTDGQLRDVLAETIGPADAFGLAHEISRELDRTSSPKETAEGRQVGTGSRASTE